MTAPIDLLLHLAQAALAAEELDLDLPPDQAEAGIAFAGAGKDVMIAFGMRWCEGCGDYAKPHAEHGA